MSPGRSFDTDKFFSYRDKDGERITRLSLAIWLVDDSTNDKPVYPIKVAIENEKIKSIKNLSGYYLFTNLEDREYTVDIKSDVYFQEQMTFDISKIRTLEKLNLNFDLIGPEKGATSIKLSDISKLQSGYVVKFHNSEGKTEQRSIISIDQDNNIIKWKKGLEFEYGENSESLFIWENVPADIDHTDEDKLIKFLKEDINLNWVESAKIEKADLKTIRIFTNDNSIDIKLDENDEKAVLRISDDRTYNLQVKEEEGKHKIYGSIVRAVDYLIEIFLKPLPSYPFPDHAILIRGSITSIVNSNEFPVDNALIKVVDYEMETKSDNNGEFVLYFREFKAGQIKITIEKNGIHKSKSIALMAGKKFSWAKLSFHDGDAA